ncbi:DUF4194 domain-containing protein [Snodgrassella gandavensis]|uniref:DUF4194 domain-containing protein n=1 Tax=Snodgrassella gandavensis TaxID=2946698 RepID=UPI001EF57D78|nr:DUF4194 domain-containing protein [Snodgrassella gandavensis]
MNQEKNDKKISGGEFFDQLCAEMIPVDSVNQPDNEIINNDTEYAQSPILQPDNIAQPESSFLPIEARHALVALLKHGVILAAQKNNIFTSICHYKVQIETHLANIYLKLILDQPYGIAYVAQMNEAIEENDEIPLLINKRQLTVHDTLILLVLRKYFQEREAIGESKIIISFEHIEELLTPFSSLTNHSTLEKKALNAALSRMKERHILANVRGSEDRYEITPIIRYIVNASFLENMLTEYRKLSEKAQSDTVEAEKEESNE